jgi:hypothetical protein
MRGEDREPAPDERERQRDGRRERLAIQEDGQQELDPTPP